MREGASVSGLLEKIGYNRGMKKRKRDKWAGWEDSQMLVRLDKKGKPIEILQAIHLDGSRVTAPPGTTWIPCKVKRHETLYRQ